MLERLWVSTLFTVFLATFVQLLGVRVITLRRRYRVSVGDGGREDVLRAIRTQGNFIEYALTFALLLIICELNYINQLFLAVVSALFLLGRLLHFCGIKSAESSLTYRTGGMALTFATSSTLIGALVYLLIHRL